MIKQGDIITTSCSRVALCSHIAVVIDRGEGLEVAHHTTDQVNELGGNTVIQPLNDFMSDRKLINIIDAKVPLQNVIQFTQENIKREWSLFYNCDDYIHGILNKKGSINRLRFISGVGVSLLLYRFFRN